MTAPEAADLPDATTAASATAGGSRASVTLGGAVGGGAAAATNGGSAPNGAAAEPAAESATGVNGAANDAAEGPADPAEGAAAPAPVEGAAAPVRGAVAGGDGGAVSLAKSEPTQTSSVSPWAQIRGVLQVVPYRRLWYCTALSSLGDWLGLLAMTALATSLAHGYRAQNYALGGVLVVQLLPAIVLGPVAGAFADRFDRRRTMIVTDFLRFVLFLTIPLAHLVVNSRETLTWLYVASFLIQCLSLFWTPAKDASIPNLVRRDQIEAANQLSLVTTYGLTPVAGAALFSMLSLITNVLARHLTFFKTQPVNLALYLNAATFLFGAIVVYFIKEIGGRGAAAAAEDGEKPPGMLRLMREGAAFVRSSRLVGGLIIGLVGAFAAGGAVIGAGKIYVTSLGGGNAAYGVLFGSVFVGLGSGIAFGPRIARELSRRRLFGLAITFGAICLILTALMPQLALAIVFVIGVGFGAGVAYLCGTTLMGTDIADEMRGRIFSLLQALIRVVLILGLACVPFVVAEVGRHKVDIFGLHATIDGTRIVLLAGGVLALGAGIWAYRKMDDRQQMSMWSDFSMSLRDPAARRRLRHGGMFIAFEGGEGSGKSTQAELLADRLRADGAAVRVTHEPGATKVGSRIRELVLHDDERLTPRAEALLFAADRAYHVDTVVRPALEAGQTVITDRFIDSSLAYQGSGRNLSMDEVRRISRWASGGLLPDLTIVLDLSADEGLDRARGRSGLDKLEAESRAFHERVRHAFRALAEAEPRRYLVVDATQSPDAIATAVHDAVRRLASRHHRAEKVARPGKVAHPAKAARPTKAGGGAGGGTDAAATEAGRTEADAGATETATPGAAEDGEA